MSYPASMFLPCSFESISRVCHNIIVLRGDYKIWRVSSDEDMASVCSRRYQHVYQLKRRRTAIMHWATARRLTTSFGFRWGLYFYYYC